MLSVESHLQILNLYARYTHHVDHGRSAEWSRCFTEDGSLSVPINNLSFTGRAELEQFAHSYFQRARDLRRPRKHIISNIAVDGDDDSASGECYVMILVGGAAEAHPAIITSGSYSDELVRTSEGWRFRTRTLSVDAP